MARALGAAAAVFTWVGWLAISPVLGFPNLSAAAMVNRAFFWRITQAGRDPDFWLGWIILIAALAGAIALFFMLERLGRVRASLRTGVIYGVVLWLVSGVVIMPLLALTEPSSGIPANFDLMYPTLMMYSLGPLAALGALIAWILFGAVLGATGSAER